MTSLPRALYDAAGVRALDCSAIEHYAIAGLTLMQRAGESVYLTIRERFPGAQHIGVFCGAGNNGGDGYVAARLAKTAGLEVTVWQLGDIGHLSADAARCLDDMRAAGLGLTTHPPRPPDGLDLIVDALLGTGLDRDVKADYAACIDRINSAPCPVLSVDVPSGLNASTGAVMGSAVCADVTVTFIGCKQGLLTGAAPDHVGRLLYDDLDVPAGVAAGVAASARRLDKDDLKTLLPRRARTAHKGSNGHVLIVGGAAGFGGAVCMAAQACARVGAGLVSVATWPEHVAAVLQHCPAVMCHGVTQPGDLNALRSRASVVAIGPGLGAARWGRSLLSALLEETTPMVVDADALNQLATDPVARDNWILTPHPGEAARLLDTDTAVIQSDRLSAAAAIQARYGGVCVLKGAGSIVADGTGVPAICPYGNPGMATGGMGDVLTGVVAGLLAQGLSLTDAAGSGVCLHSVAADLAAGDGERGLIATDLMPMLRRLVN